LSWHRVNLTAMAGSKVHGVTDPTEVTSATERRWEAEVGAGIAGAGLAEYRIARRRRRRGSRPVGFVSEAIVAVDLVDSTGLATHYGNGVAMRARAPGAGLRQDGHPHGWGTALTDLPAADGMCPAGAPASGGTAIAGGSL